MRSARTHLPGQGHVPLPEARRWALEQVEAREDEVAARLEELHAAAVTMRTATEAHAAALRATASARTRLTAAREDLAYRLSDGNEAEQAAEAGATP